MLKRTFVEGRMTLGKVEGRMTLEKTSYSWCYLDIGFIISGFPLHLSLS